MRDPYVSLHSQIVGGDLSPGERLVEQDLAEQLGVGRAAIRTAFVRLEQEGLVERKPNRGASVRRVTEKESVEILEARSVLEGLAAGQAATLATPSDVDELRGIVADIRDLLDSGDLQAASERDVTLHRRILEISKHETAQRICATLTSQLVRFHYRTILAWGRAPELFAEHTAVVEAIAAGDSVAAEGAMRSHLRNVSAAMSERATGHDELNAPQAPEQVGAQTGSGS